MTKCPELLQRVQASVSFCFNADLLEQTLKSDKDGVQPIVKQQRMSLIANTTTKALQRSFTRTNQVLSYLANVRLRPSFWCQKPMYYNVRKLYNWMKRMGWTPVCSMPSADLPVGTVQTGNRIWGTYSYDATLESMPALCTQTDRRKSIYDSYIARCTLCDVTNRGRLNALYFLIPQTNLSRILHIPRGWWNPIKTNPITRQENNSCRILGYLNKKPRINGPGKYSSAYFSGRLRLDSGV